ncbi:ATP synthase subunit c [Dissostichus eleginoides]|uniref:ATP synthase subunit c n=1 Tax=Dissostichus eleginoides TaxID=100907 RepID=A0AAD9BHE7_DISEL|nr:ATP synthase subunit c [Dissostichus eleginoides]
MTLYWRALFLLCCVLSCVQSFSPSPVLQRSKYNDSFSLTRSTRTRVQQLQKKYKEQQLGNKHFEDRSRQLNDLPLLSTDFYSWLKLTDWERLHSAFVDMQAYWNS